jgi:predicted transcriptional regulator of viral defense system
LVASCVRPDAVFSHHAALELLGAAHSDWSTCTVQTVRRRPPLEMEGTRIVFLLPAPPLRSGAHRKLGTRQIDRQGQSLTVAGPERTLLEGFRQPHFVGGLEELVESAAGFGVLDLDLLLKLLERLDTRMLWAAVGWFLERYQRRFYVDSSYLAMLEERRPRSRQYLPRGQRKGGVLANRWNLVLPATVVSPGEPDES